MKLIKGGMRRDTAPNWSIANPILGISESGFEIDTGLFKVGNGITKWNDLPYANTNEAGVTANAGVIMEVPADDKLYVRTRNSDSIYGGWVEVPVQEAPEDGLYARNGESKSWEKIDLDSKANLAYMKVRDKVENAVVDKLYLKENNIAETSSILIRQNDIDLFKLIYDENANITLCQPNEENTIISTLCSGGIWNTHNDTIDQLRVTFNDNKELSFSSPVEIIVESEAIKDYVDIDVERPVDLQVVVDRLVELEAKVKELENR